MVKGVNKNIIEISDTGNDYFDRAILFVRPARLSDEGDTLRRKGQEYLWNLQLRPWSLRTGLLSTALKLGAGALAGAAVTAMFFLLA